jgi:hypothetical protein
MLTDLELLIWIVLTLVLSAGKESEIKLDIKLTATSELSSTEGLVEFFQEYVK